MKKIVFTIEQLYGGGAERVTAVLINELCKQNEVHLLTYKADPEKEYDIDPRVIRHDMGEPPAGKLGGIAGRVRFMRSTILQIAPDCVVSLALPRMVSLLMIALLGKKIPVVLSERNDPARFPASKLLRVLRIWSYMRCDGLVFQTGDARAFFPKCIARKGIIITNPITGSLPERYEGVRESRIVNCCRLTEQKNLPLLIDAFSDIAGEFPEHTLHIYGEGPLRESLEQRIHKLGLDGRIFLPGYCERIYDEMRTAAMFVSSSDYEGISNSMLEAISLGVPTICTDCPVGGARETIQNGYNGMLVPTGDRPALAEAMRRVLADGELAEQLSLNGAQLAGEISPGAIARKWQDYIERVIT